MKNRYRTDSVYWYAHLITRRRVVALLATVIMALIVQGFVAPQFGSNWSWAWAAISIALVVLFLYMWDQLVFYEVMMIDDMQPGWHSRSMCYDKWKARHFAWHMKEFGKEPNVKQFGDND